MGYRIGRKQRQLNKDTGLAPARKSENTVTGTKNKDTGFTLVELIVCFALLGIFMVCAMLIISSVMGIYYHAKGVDTGRQVADMVTTKVVGEIEGAVTGADVNDTEVSGIESAVDSRIAGTDNTGSFMEYMAIGDDGSYIDFYDRTGSHVKISVVDDYIDIYYYPVVIGDNSGTKPGRGVDWTFDPKTYQGYRVSNMIFTHVGGNIIKLELTVHSDKYGDYTSIQYIECYNFTDTDISGIVSK